MKRVRRFVFRGCAVAALMAVVVAAAGWWLLRGSLPQVGGDAALPGLEGPVVIERDDLGIPTIRGGSRVDVARATGFVHAQDRFFQMDLLRRSAAGELSALFGPAALESDRRARWHRLRSRARAALSRTDLVERALLEAYVGGVNAGMAALRVRPFEYFLLRSAPQPWTLEDSLLVGWSMFLDLNRTDGRLEQSREAMKETLSPQFFEFLAGNGSAWSSRLDGTFDPVLPIPGPAYFPAVEVASRAVPPAGGGARGTAPAAEDPTQTAGLANGSNNWAVAGRLTARGGNAIVANDMHLSLRNLPRLWYRARLVVAGGKEAPLEVSGVTLPGLPAVIVGSNGRVAWGFTNSNVDVADVIEVEADPADPEVYLTPQGPRRLERFTETIAVRGGSPVEVVVEETVWGPLLPRPSRADGRALAVAWVGHDPSLVNLGVGRLESAREVDDALAVAATAWTPAQNLVVGGRDGRIAWALCGPVPRRVGFDGSFPVSMADGSRRWEGMLPPGERPAIIDPPSGRAWTANAPVVGGAAGRLLGDGGSRHDGRAFQIGSRLQSRDTWDEIALFELQLDSETQFLRRWRDLALGLLETGGPPDPASGRARFRGAIAAWDGHARRDSTGHRLVRQFRREAADAVMARLLAPCRAAFAGFSPADVDYEEALWALVSQRPSWAAREDGWEGELLECVDRVVASLPGGAASVGVEKWGEHNRLDMCHPLARGMAFLRGWLAAPRDGVSGDSYAPNALYRYHGPSQRMVVAPGREESGIMNLPGGQSGHPLSPYFLAGHAAWVEGWPTRFLPGETVHRLVCAPAATGP